MSILDSFSALHNYKQQHGLNAVDTDAVSAYVLESRLRRILSSLIGETRPRELTGATGLTAFQVRNIRESKLLHLTKPELADAIALCESDGLAACLKFLHRL